MSKSENLVIDFAAIHDSGLAQRSPRDRDVRFAANVVAQFVAAHHRDWIGFRFTITLDSNHVFLIVDGRFIGVRHGRVVKNWKCIFGGRATRILFVVALFII